MFSSIDFCEESGKPIYDKKGAQSAINLRMKRDHTKLRMYHCDKCNGWHLTKQMYFEGKNFKRYGNKT